MKKVVLLGDSIRLGGYGPLVAQGFAGEFEVWQPDDNCRYVKYTQRGLHDWHHAINGADVIHWNNGIWDTLRIMDGDNFTPVDLYVAEMVRTAAALQRRGKVVIFATTTPILPGYRHTTNEDIDRYNAAVVPRLREMGVVINDLNGLLRDQKEKYICEDQLHLSEEGRRVCAERVMAVIRQNMDLTD